MLLGIGVSIGIVLYIIIGLISFRWALADQYAKRYPDRTKWLERNCNYYSDAEKREDAHNWASRPDPPTLAFGLLWPIALVAELVFWLVESAHKFTLNDAKFERVRQSVETKNERAERLAKEEQDREALANWKPPEGSGYED